MPATYADAVRELARGGIVPQETADRVAEQVGLRNALVHSYLDVGDAKVYAALTQLEDIRRFSAAVWEWVQGE